MIGIINWLTKTNTKINDITKKEKKIISSLFFMEYQREFILIFIGKIMA